MQNDGPERRLKRARRHLAQMSDYDSDDDGTNELAEELDQIHDEVDALSAKVDALTKATANGRARSAATHALAFALGWLLAYRARRD